MISFLRRLFGKRANGAAARRGVAGDSVTMVELAALLRRRALVIARPGKFPNDYAAGAGTELIVIANDLEAGETIAGYVEKSEARAKQVDRELKATS